MIRLLCLFLCCINIAYAEDMIEIKILSTQEPIRGMGVVKVTESPYGLLITPQLNGLTSGAHGLHFHEHHSCAHGGMAAGGHLDPKNTYKHLGPYDTKGHLGDIPVLIVNNNGSASLPLLAPKLKFSDILGHTLMIHAGGDNYSDSPQALGGGGERIACGLVKLIS